MNRESSSTLKFILAAALLLFPMSLSAWNTPVINSGGNTFTKYTWTGNDFAVNSNWSNPKNWCGSYIDGACQGAATAPGGTDPVVFNNACGAHCNATIDSNITVDSIVMQPSYSGTITQGASNVTFTGASGGGYTQYAGTWQGGTGTFTVGPATAQKFIFAGGNFIGGAGNIAIGSSAPADIAYFSGGNFTASSGVTRINGVADFRGLASFTHSSGMFEFYTGTSSTVGGHWFTGTNAIFNNAKFFAPTTSNISMNSTTIVIDGDLTLSGAALSPVGYADGTFELRQGNVYRGGAAFSGTAVVKFTGTGVQTIDMTGSTSPNFPGIWAAQTAITGSVKFIGTALWTSGGFLVTGNMGTIDLNGMTDFSFYSNNPQGNDYDTQGYVTFPKVTFGNNTLRLRIGTVKTVDMVISGSGSPNATNTTGVIEVSGNVSFAGAGSVLATAAKLKMVGGADQVVDCAIATICGMPNLEIDKTAGNVSFINGVPAVFATFNYVTAGSFTVPAQFRLGYSTGTQANSLTSNGIIWNDVLIGRQATSGNNVTFTDTLKVSGDLIFANTNAGSTNLYGTIELTGDLSCIAQGSGLKAVTGGGTIKFVGAAQSIDMTLCNATPSSAGLVSLPHLTIDSTAGTVSSTTNFSLGGYTHVSGSANFVGSTITTNFVSGWTITPGPTEFGNVIFNQAASFVLSGTMKINGDTTFNAGGGGQNITGGTIEMWGNMTTASTGHGGTAALTFKGVDTTLTKGTGSFPTGTITVAKNAANKVQLGAAISLATGQSVNVTSGSLDMNSFNFTVNGVGTLTLAATTTVVKAGGTLTVGGSSIPSGPYSGGNIVP